MSNWESKCNMSKFNTDSLLWFNNNLKVILEYINVLNFDGSNTTSPNRVGTILPARVNPHHKTRVGQYGHISHFGQ